MSVPNQPDERERLLRIELGKRTVGLDPRDEDARNIAGDTSYVENVGKEISRLIYEERLEQARERLQGELSQYPSEPGFLNLQMALDMLEKPGGDYKDAKKYGGLLMASATERGSSFYISVALNNLGLVAHNEGHDEFSNVMYLASHYIDGKSISPMRNLACWYSRRNLLEEAQKWIEAIINTHPDWVEREEIVTFLEMDESLRDLRDYDPFKESVLDKIEEHKRK